MNQKLSIILIIFILSSIIWVFWNPPRRFGLHFFGFTVYNRIPLPYSDLKIHSDGSFSLRQKSHFVSFDEVYDLLDEKPEVLIVGKGYDGLVEVDERILNSTVEIEILETPKAFRRFNELRDDGRKIAAVIHSTC